MFAAFTSVVGILLVRGFRSLAQDKESIKAVVNREDSICENCGHRLGSHFTVELEGPYSCPIGEVLRGPHPSLRFSLKETEHKVEQERHTEEIS